MILAIVVCGSFQEYEDFLKERGVLSREYRYARRPEDLFGLRGVDVFMWGRYWENPLYASGEIDLKIALGDLKLQN